MPDSLRAGVKTGQFKASGFLPKRPTAGEEYTSEQRRIIDAQLDEAAKGPFHGPPSDTADEMVAHIKGELKRRTARKKTKLL